MKRPTEYVYLIGSADSHTVKIGRSIDVERRLADIQRMSPAKLAVLWKTEGGSDLEAALHRRFTEYRSHGEWFDFGGLNSVDLVEEAVRDFATHGPPQPEPSSVRPRRSRAAVARQPEPTPQPDRIVDGAPVYDGLDDLGGYERFEWVRRRFPARGGQ